MKKIIMAMTLGVIVFAFSACGQKSQNNETADSVTGNLSESKEEEQPVIGKDDVLQNLAGEYEYLSNYGAGKLTIKKTSYGYDVSDYESESSYRFLADSSNIETIEGNRIYIKYPEQIFSDGEAVFRYYILEYGTDEIDVYYGEASFEETEFLYHATKRMQSEEDELTVNPQENSGQAVENTDSETTAEELFDLFINGSISAANSTDLTSEFYITDLNMDSEEGDAYSIGESRS